MQKRARVVLAAASLSFFSASALAQEASSASEFRDKGRAAMASGDTAGACLLYEQAYQAAVKETAAGTPGAPPPDEVLFDVASCHEKQGKTQIAATEYDQVAQAGGAKAQDAKG